MQLHAKGRMKYSLIELNSRSSVSMSSAPLATQTLTLLIFATSQRGKLSPSTRCFRKNKARLAKQAALSFIYHMKASSVPWRGRKNEHFICPTLIFTSGQSWRSNKILLRTLTWVNEEAWRDIRDGINNVSWKNDDLLVICEKSWYSTKFEKIPTIPLHDSMLRTILCVSMDEAFICLNVISNKFIEKQHGAAPA